jgi:hypothetical protein
MNTRPDEPTPVTFVESRVADLTASFAKIADTITDSVIGAAVMEISNQGCDGDLCDLSALRKAVYALVVRNLIEKACQMAIKGEGENTPFEGLAAGIP